jgi:hypothetical protein
MTRRSPFFPRYRTVRVVPWWWPAVGPVGLAVLIVWAGLFIWTCLGGRVVPS